ncbi:MAG TPA: AraC family transcriptional regulator [Burkholderiaceae bacterium]|nr:AraC family transcriptional regulator [Burkholderiaceae bacterium]
MHTDVAPSFVRRTLFVGEWLQIGHIAVRPESSECGDVETSELNVLALPLAGMFAKHDGPRRHAIATPSHALLISAGKPYRLSFPGCIGDRCLALRLTSDALAHVMPDAMAGGGFDEARFASQALLPPELMLARSQLWRDLASGEVDALEAEERGISLLEAALGAARGQLAAPRRSRSARPRGRARRVARTVEAVCAQPHHKWTLGELARLASLSPGHLAHVFRAEMGISAYSFVVRSRLAGALDAVLETDVGLTEVAMDAGFASHSHFTAKFRQFFGRTPQELRRGVRSAGVRSAGVRELRRIVAAPEPVAA